MLSTARNLVKIQRYIRQRFITRSKANAHLDNLTLTNISGIPLRGLHEMSAAYESGTRALWAGRVIAVILLTGLLWGPPLLATETVPERSGVIARNALTSDELELGRRVFQRKCNKCHGSGREDAPKIGLPGAWTSSLQQPVSVLIEHAINGHTGARGRMPPKGDFDSLSGAEVTAAVYYIVARGEWLASQYRLSQPACLQNDESKSCVPADPIDTDLLRLLWILNGVREQL